MPNLTLRRTLLAIAAFAALLSLSGFVLEYGFHVLPCKMCWWQRYAHYAILALSLLGLTLPPRKATLISLYPLIFIAFLGLAIATWQFAAQHGWLPFPASCTAAGMPTYASGEDLLAAINATKIVPCDKETFTLFGLSLAGYNIPAMLLIIGLAIRALKPRP